ncbi:hypothetical protein ZWY2020_016863 [Hordeum vulgare]|nr:hypothetical protein ZWY2020_016863 [Hordeum vulgare]
MEDLDQSAGNPVELGVWGFLRWWLARSMAVREERGAALAPQDPRQIGEREEGLQQHEIHGGLGRGRLDPGGAAPLTGISHSIPSVRLGSPRRSPCGLRDLEQPSSPLLTVALVFSAGAAVEEQAVVYPAGVGEIAAGGVKEAAEAATLRAELAQLREKISVLGQSTALLASAAV